MKFETNSILVFVFVAYKSCQNLVNFKICNTLFKNHQRRVIFVDLCARRVARSDMLIFHIFFRLHIPNSSFLRFRFQQVCTIFEKPCYVNGFDYFASSTLYRSVLGLPRFIKLSRVIQCTRHMNPHYRGGTFNILSAGTC